MRISSFCVKILFYCICALFFHSIFAFPIADQNKLNMKLISKPSPNAIPTILVHGFGNASHFKIGGKTVLYYWGGFPTEDHPNNSFQENLIKNSNSPVFIAKVSPFGSNFDRAVELFAQIKGSCVIYGEKHAKNYGHLPFYPENKSSNNEYAFEKISIEKNDKGYEKYLGKHFVRCFSPGFYPEWDDNHPVHLIGHSLGGQTIRVLEALLNQKNVRANKEESSNAELLEFKLDPVVQKYLFCNQINKEKETDKFKLTPPENITECMTRFSKGTSIKTLLTVAAPNLGTTFISILKDPLFGEFGGPTLDDVLFHAAEFTNEILSHDLMQENNYDSWLDHWPEVNTKKNEGYHKNLIKQNLRQNDMNDEKGGFTKTKDFSLYDLSVDGAKKLNEQILSRDVSPNVYYFSVANRLPPLKGYQLVENFQEMLHPLANLFHPFVPLLTSAVKNEKNIPKLYKNLWKDNDGVVNTFSMLSPNEKDYMKDYLKLMKKDCMKIKNKKTFLEKRMGPGKWNFICNFQDFDHLDTIGWSQYENTKSSYDAMLNFYTRYILYINNLPNMTAIKENNEAPK